MVQLQHKDKTLTKARMGDRPIEIEASTNPSRFCCGITKCNRESIELDLKRFSDEFILEIIDKIRFKATITIDKLDLDKFIKTMKLSMYVYDQIELNIIQLRPEQKVLFSHYGLTEEFHPKKKRV